MTKHVIAFIVLAAALSGAAPPVIAPLANQEDTARSSAQQAIEAQLASLDKQRQSIHQQIGKPVDAIGMRIDDFIDPFPALAQAPCPALDRGDVNDLITSAARKQALAPELLRAVMKRESAFRPCAVSVRGAQGLMQLMPATSERFHVSDPFDPSQNVYAGAAFLKQLLTRYKGDLRLALAAYNAGPVRADQQASRPFPIETQNYLAGIFADLNMSDAVVEDAEVSEDSELPAIGDAVEPTAQRIIQPVIQPVVQASSQGLGQPLSQSTGKDPDQTAEKSQPPTLRIEKP